MIKNVINKLYEPFPARQETRQNLVDNVFTSVLVAVFLYLFNPFRLDSMPMGLPLAALGFGFISFFCSLFYEWFMHSVMQIRTDQPSWTLWKWILYIATLVCWIAIGNFTFVFLSIPEVFGWSKFVYMLKATLMVGITPIVISGFLIQTRALRRHQQDAYQIAEVKQRASCRSDNQSVKLKDVDAIIELDIANEVPLKIPIVSIRAVEAMQNYVMIYHYDSTAKQLKETIIRATIAGITEQLNESTVIRSHRSFLVNLTHVSRVDGNAQGLKLSINGMNKQSVPVSRRYIPAIKKALNINT